MVLPAGRADAAAKPDRIPERGSARHGNNRSAPLASKPQIKAAKNKATGDEQTVVSRHLSLFTYRRFLVDAFARDVVTTLLLSFPRKLESIPPEHFHVNC